LRLHRALATTAAALVLGLAGGAPAAHADPVDDDADPCTFTQAKLSPDLLTLGLKTVGTSKVTATATNCDNHPTGISVGLEEGGNEGYIVPSAKDPTHWVGTIEINAQSLRNENARTTRIYVNLYGPGGSPPRVGRRKPGRCA
jgi:hypothetical protein